MILRFSLLAGPSANRFKVMSTDFSDQPVSGAMQSGVDGLEASALADLLSPAPAELIPGALPTSMGPRYEVRGLLGEGGQGIVLSVRDRRLERDIAAKLARSDRHGAEVYLEREARLAASLEHPNILPVYDLSETPDGAPLMLMRRAPGRSLEDVLRQSEKSGGLKLGAVSGFEGRAARIRAFLQLAEAISYAHSRSVLHLDIKPANVRIGDYGEIFLMDWGLARRLTDSSAPVGGTAPYMAPEILEGLPPDERADVYSLGVTLYRMISGGLMPLDGDTFSTETYRHALANQLPIPLLHRKPDLDPNLAAVIDKACCPDRLSRYRKVRDMVADIEAALDGRSVTARRPGASEYVLRWIKKHSRLISYAAVAALLMLACAVVLWSQYSARQGQLRRAEADRIRARARVPLDKGRELLRQEPPDHDSALLLFAKAAEIDPKFAEVYYAIGLSQAALGKWKAARINLETAAQKDPSLLMARYHAGKILMERERDTEGAGRQFAIMRELDSEHEYSLLGEGWLATLRGHWSRALELAARAEVLNSGLVDVHDLRGYIYSCDRSNLRSPGKAVISYDLFLAARPESVTALNNRAYALIRLKKFREAEGDLNNALALAPNYLPALRNRSFLLARRGAVMEAIADFDSAQQLQPSASWIYLSRGEVYEKIGHLAKARTDFLAAAKVMPRSSLPLLKSGRLEMRARNFKKAIEHYRAAMSLADFVDISSVRRRLALALLFDGQRTHSEAEFKTNIVERQSGFRLYAGFFLWRIMFESGRQQQAHQMLAAQLLDKREPRHLRLAGFYCLGLVEELQVLLGCRNQGQLCEAFYYIGLAKVAFGELEEAKIFFEDCRKLARHDFTEYLLAELEIEEIEKPGPD
jgi:tetratricopeptide (TPR) repeat protein